MNDPISLGLPWQPVDSRWESLRYYCLYRLILASGLALLGHAFIGELEGKLLWNLVVGGYFTVAVGLLFLRRHEWLSYRLVLNVQIVIDLFVLLGLMYITGGHRGGMSYLIMVVVAAGGLLGEGRLVYLYAALATIGVLCVQTVRVMATGADPGTELGAVSLLSLGFFAVATVARLLAFRALQNERLARDRGSALARQILVNERIIAELHDGVVVVSKQGVVRQINPQAAALLGPRARPGTPISETAPELASAIEQELGEVALVDGPRVRLRLHMTGDAGDQVVFLEDLEQIELEAQQIKLAALGRLTGGIAHEVRNPLAAISHAGELLSEEKRADMQTRLVRIILDNTRRIDRMVSDVLELGRRDRVTTESIRLELFVRGFLDESTSLSGLEQGLVEMHVPSEITVSFDRIHLQQVLWNLVGNARRYCSGRPGAISIAAARRGDGRVAIDIRDDGPGLASETRSRAFEPFYTTHSKGTGLGLYIARELAQANDAELELCESSSGAHFRLTTEGGT